MTVTLTKPVTRVVARDHRLVGSDVVDFEVRILNGDERITDRVAATIASYWQSGGPDGEIFLRFAQGFPVDTDALLRAISRMHFLTDRNGRQELEALTDFVLTAH